MSSTDYSVLLSRDGDGLHAYVSGQRSLASTIACWDDILDHVQAWSPRWLLLCDALQGSELSAGEWREVVGTRMVALEGVRMAHVKPLSDSMDDPDCAGYAREAGLDARAFVDAGDAERWLRHGVEETPATRRSEPA